MKISFVTDTYAPQPNGLAITLQILIKHLREIGHEVDLIRPSALDCDETGLEVPSIALPVYRNIRVGISRRKKIQTHWSQNRPDVIYVSSGSPLGASAISAARVLNIPIASGFHTNFQQYMSYYQAGFLETPVLKYLKYVHNRSNCTFVYSKDLVGQLSEKGFRNLEFLPKGVDTNFYTPSKRDPSLRAEWGVKNGNDLVGIYVGRMAAEKNLELAVHSFVELRRKVPNFRGIFVGDGPKLTKLKRKHPEFIYTGEISGEDLARCYASADLFISPSITETFGNVTLEAMASGLGVIAFDYAAARDHIKNRENGYSVPFGDEEAFVAAALTAANDPYLSEVGSAARSSSEKAHSSKAVECFEKKLLELIKRQNPNSALV